MPACMMAAMGSDFSGTLIDVFKDLAVADH